MMGGMGMGVSILGMIFMLGFRALLILAGVWVAKGLFGNNRPRREDGPALTPRQILDQRYARGEITREQYEIMKQDIG